MLSLKTAVLLGALLAIVVTIFEQKKYKKLDKELKESLTKLKKIDIPSPQECALNIFQSIETTNIITGAGIPDEATSYIELLLREQPEPLRSQVQLGKAPPEKTYEDFDEFEPFGSTSHKKGYNYFGQLQYKYS